MKTSNKFRIDYVNLKGELIETLRTAIETKIKDSNPGGGRLVFEDEGIDAFDDEAGNEIIGVTETEVIFADGMGSPDEDEYPLEELDVEDALYLLSLFE